jgi:hypothetical protein
MLSLKALRWRVPDMNSDKQRERAVNKVKELHLNVRHITQLGMNWFAFFVTVNYLTMGWLAKGPDGQKVNLSLIWIVAIVFIVQNLVGIFGLAWVLIAAMAMKRQVDTFEKSAKNDSQKSIPKELYKHLRHPRSSLHNSEKESIPAQLYTWIGVFLMLVLISLIVAWTYIGGLTPFNSS